MHLSDRLGSRAGRLDSLNSMYWNVFLRGIGTSLMGLFVPVYIFLIGKDMGGVVTGLRLLVLYLIIQRVLLFLVTIPMVKLVERLGFRVSVLLGSSFLVLYYLVPIWGGESVWAVVMMALVAVVSIPLYWLSRHSLLSGDGVSGKLGKQVGMVTLLDRGAGILAPVVGGVVVTLFGFKVLFALGAVMVMFSCVPLFYMKHHTKDGQISWKSFLEWIGDKDKKHLGKAFAGEGIDGAVSGFFWPVYVFVLVGSLEVLGGLTSLSLLAAMVTTYLAGRLFDKSRAKGGLEDEKAYWWSGGVVSVLRVLRASVSSVFGLLGVDVLTKILSAYYWVPYGGYLYSAGKVNGGLKLYAYREMVYSLFVVVVAVAIFFVSAFSWRWWGIFGVSAVGIWLTMGLAKES
jgi:hypothetical protein